MSDHHQRDMIKWWAMLLAGVAAALLFAWLGHLAGVTMSTLPAIGAGGIGLAWLIVLVTVPWNLYFAARRTVAEVARSRDRGISVPSASDAEAGRIARRMLWFALGAHLLSTAATALITYFSGHDVGYYFAGFFLFSTIIRPGLAYLAHVRERITTLAREIKYPRDDVALLKARVSSLADDLKQARAEQAHLTDVVHRTERTLTGDMAHAQQVVTIDLARVQDAQADDRAAARSRADDLERRIDQMVRRIEDTLDGISDHQELLTGIRALARMFRPDPASP